MRCARFDKIQTSIIRAGTGFLLRGILLSASLGVGFMTESIGERKVNYEEIMQEILDRIEGAANCYVDVDGEGCMESAILASEAVGIAQDVIDEKAVYRWRPIEAYTKPSPGNPGFGQRLLIVVDTGPGSVQDFRHAMWDGMDWCFESGHRALELGYRVTQYMPMPSLPGDNQ